MEAFPFFSRAPGRSTRVGESAAALNQNLVVHAKEEDVKIDKYTSISRYQCMKMSNYGVITDEKTEGNSKTNCKIKRK